MAGLTPYYDDGQCVIYNADCRAVLPTLGFCECPHHGAAKPPVLACANPLHAVFRYCPSPDECAKDYEMREAV